MFDTYAYTMLNIFRYSGKCPVGIAQKSRGSLFLGKDFTPEVQKLAEEGYLEMKRKMLGS